MIIQNKENLMLALHVGSRIFRNYKKKYNIERLNYIMNKSKKYDLIIEFGSGYGYQCLSILLNINNVKRYVAIDNDPYAIVFMNAALKENKIDKDVSVILHDITTPTHTIYGPDALFLCTEVLEHVKEYKKAIENISAQVQVGTHGIFSVPAYNKLTKVKGHINNFKPEYLKNILFENNFNVLEYKIVSKLYSIFFVVKSKG